MVSDIPQISRKKTGTTAPVCLSCGLHLSGQKRRYCSIACRQELRTKLMMHTGLLKALHVRYATFSFTPDFIIMDILPHGARTISSFLYPRTTTRKPGDDFLHMATSLGSLWWQEKKKTNRNYLAARQVLSRARQPEAANRSIKPLEVKIPAVKGKTFLQLNIGRADLESCEYRKIIKKMYRRQAMKHHPDRGGSPTAFRKIHEAYEELLSWAENPTFINRKGFPDRWFYNSTRNRWVQPIPNYRIAEETVI